MTRPAAASLLLAVAALGPTGPAPAVEPGFRLYADQFPRQPLERVVFGYDADNVPLSSLFAEGFADAAALEAASAWDLGAATGDDVVTQFVPVDPLWSCSVPAGCAGLIAPAAGRLLLAEDAWAATPPARGLTLLDFDGTGADRLRAQVLDEGGAGELRVCFDRDVPFLLWPGVDGSRRFLAEGDPPWTSGVFDCVAAAAQGGTCAAGGQPGYLGPGSGAAGELTGRVARTGTLTLPSGHVIDTALVEIHFSFQVYGARVGSTCTFPVQRLRQYLLLWLLPHHGPIAQVASTADVADLGAFTVADSTVLGYGLLPPVSLQVTDVGPDSITLSWDPGRMGSRPPETWDVHWGTESGKVTPPPFSATTAATVYTVTGLQGDTRYCLSVSSRRDYTDPVSGLTTTYRSIALPDTIGADVDGDGARDTEYPPEVCVTTGTAALLALLRDHLTALDPPSPPKGQVLPLDPVADRYLDPFSAGGVDPAPLAEPLVFYAWDPARAIRLVRAGASVRVE